MQDGCFKCDGGDQEELQELIEQNIETFGLACQGVFSSPVSPCFTYTIGLTASSYPELIITGIDMEPASGILNRLSATYTILGQSPKRGDVITGLFGNDYLCRLGSVSSENVSGWLCQAVYRQERRNMRPPKALQLIFPDTKGKFPLEEDYDTKFLRDMPCLAPNDEWDYLPESSTITATDVSAEEFFEMMKQRRNPN